MDILTSSGRPTSRLPIDQVSILSFEWQLSIRYLTTSYTYSEQFIKRPRALRATTTTAIESCAGWIHWIHTAIRIPSEIGDSSQLLHVNWRSRRLLSIRGSRSFWVTWTMFASRWASRRARTAVVAVAVVVAVDYCRVDGSSWKNATGDRLADSVAVPATADNRCRSWTVAGCSMAAAAAAPRPAAADKTTADRVAPAGAADEQLGPSPRASYPALPASRATCTVRSPDHRICPNLVPPEPKKSVAQRGFY